MNRAFILALTVITTIAPPSYSQTSEAPPGMVLIPGGSFMMGDDNGQDMEKPVHEVEVSAFYMDTHEVTIGEFAKFVEETGYVTDAEKSEAGGYYWNGEAMAQKKGINWRFNEVGYPHQTSDYNHPVANISWNDASAYAKWAGKRLPTEAEWEYAARGGSKGYKFAWGNEPLGKEVVANVSDENLVKVIDWPHTEGYDDGYIFAAPVGSFVPNALGLYDMAGNSWEWCADYFDENYYSRSPKQNPRNDDPNEGNRRVMRGNSWDARPGMMRCSRRTSEAQANTYTEIGIRCVKDVN